jgi:hypothetical protein
MRNRSNFAIAIQLPRFATEDDEDTLREGMNGREDWLSSIFQRLKSGDEGVVHAVLGLAQCLERMARAATNDDDEELSEWADHACEMADKLHHGEGEED